MAQNKVEGRLQVWQSSQRPGNEWSLQIKYNTTQVYTLLWLCRLDTYMYCAMWSGIVQINGGEIEVSYEYV